MKSNKTNDKKMARKRAFVALVLSLSLAGVSYPSYAQGLSAGQAGLLDQSRGLSPEKDTLLPPPVVPVDPGAATKHVNATTKELNLETSKSLAAPNSNSSGHMNMHPVTSGYMSAQDKRQAAFQSLMQPGNLSPSTSQNNYQIYNQGFTGGQSAQAGNAQAQLAQPDWLAPQAQQVRAYHNVGQVQTLTATSRTPIVRRDTRRGGLANNLSGALNLGTGLFTGGLKRPNSLMGLGVTGLMMTGFGRR